MSFFYTFNKNYGTYYLKNYALNNIDFKTKYIPSFSNLNCMFLDPENLKIAGYGRNEERVYKCKNELKIVHLLAHRSGFATPEKS